MLSLRLASAVVAVPLLLGIAYFGDKTSAIGSAAYGLVITGASLAAAWEVRGMMRSSGLNPLSLVLFATAGFLPFHAWYLVARVNGEPTFDGDGMTWVALAVIASLTLLLFRRRVEGALVDWAVSLSMGVYIGGLMQFYAPLRDRPDGGFWVMAAIGLSWICDSTAYFVGRAFGRTRLAPAISPKKSVEGAVAGFVGAAVFGVLIAAVTGRPPAMLAAFGAAIASATIVGDLAESLLKRQTGVKDSGVLIPGHGGILDRMDSLLFCAPVAVLFLRAVG